MSLLLFYPQNRTGTSTEVCASVQGAKIQILFVILPSKYKKIGNNLEVGTKFSTFALE
jgi:hypothetical protein